MNKSVFHLTLHILCRFRTYAHLAPKWHGFPASKLQHCPLYWFDRVKWNTSIMSESLDSTIATNHAVSALRDLISKINLKELLMYFHVHILWDIPADHIGYKHSIEGQLISSNAAVSLFCAASSRIPVMISPCCHIYKRLIPHNSGYKLCFWFPCRLMWVWNFVFYTGEERWMRAFENNVWTRVFELQKEEVTDD